MFVKAAHKLSPQTVGLLVAAASLLLHATSANARPPRGSETPDERRTRELEDRGRRPPDGPTSGTADAMEIPEQTLDERLVTGDGCDAGSRPALREALMALANPADSLLSIEAWGDSEVYQPYQTVYFHMRVPRRSHVTLFWLGPDDSVFIPFADLLVPPHRDVRVDADAIIVPPLGRERWVVIAAIEPTSFPCFATERAQLRWVERIAKRPYAVGQWEVVSTDTPPRPETPAGPKR